MWLKGEKVVKSDPKIKSKFISILSVTFSGRVLEAFLTKTVKYITHLQEGHSSQDSQTPT